MKLRHIKFLHTLFQWFKNENLSPKVPLDFSNDERIIRTVYSPFNIDRKKGTLNPNLFKSPFDIDEISVNRLNYTTANFCKKISKDNQAVGKRDYFGFAVLLKKEITNSNCSIVYSPITEPKEKINYFHSDIKVGQIAKRGEQYPSEISKKIKDLTDVARFYIDPLPTSNDWTGDDLK